MKAGKFSESQIVANAQASRSQTAGQRPDRRSDHPRTRGQRGHFLQLEGQVWRHAGSRSKTVEGFGGRESAAQENVR